MPRHTPWRPLRPLLFPPFPCSICPSPAWSVRPPLDLAKALRSVRAIFFIIVLYTHMVDCLRKFLGLFLKVPVKHLFTASSVRFSCLNGPLAHKNLSPIIIHSQGVVNGENGVGYLYFCLLLPCSYYIQDCHLIWYNGTWILFIL